MSIIGVQPGLLGAPRCPRTPRSGADVGREVLAGEGGPTQVADARGLELVQDDGALQAAVDKVIAANADVAEKIRGGKVQAAGALIGQVMKEMRGQADAARARELILASLDVQG